MSFIQIWAPSPLTRTAKRLKINSATSQRTSSPLGLSRFTFQRTQRHWWNPKRKEKNHTKHTNKLLNSLSYPKPKAAPKQWNANLQASKCTGELQTSDLVAPRLPEERRRRMGYGSRSGGEEKWLDRSCREAEIVEDRCSSDRNEERQVAMENPHWGGEST